MDLQRAIVGARIGGKTDTVSGQEHEWKSKPALRRAVVPDNLCQQRVGLSRSSKTSDAQIARLIVLVFFWVISSSLVRIPIISTRPQSRKV